LLELEPASLQDLLELVGREIDDIEVPFAIVTQFAPGSVGAAAIDDAVVSVQLKAGRNDGVGIGRDRVPCIVTAVIPDDDKVEPSFGAEVGTRRHGWAQHGEEAAGGKREFRRGWRYIIDSGGAQVADALVQRHRNFVRCRPIVAASASEWKLAGRGLRPRCRNTYCSSLVTRHSSLVTFRPPGRHQIPFVDGSSAWQGEWSGSPGDRPGVVTPRHHGSVRPAGVRRDRSLSRSKPARHARESRPAISSG
jgi:hypothetical protein